MNDIGDAFGRVILSAREDKIRRVRSSGCIPVKRTVGLHSAQAPGLDLFGWATFKIECVQLTQWWWLVE